MTMNGMKLLKKRIRKSYKYKFHLPSEFIPEKKLVYWWDWEGKKHEGYFVNIYWSIYSRVFIDSNNWSIFNHSNLAYWKYKT